MIKIFEEKTFDVVAVGQAIVDIIAKIDDHKNLENAGLLSVDSGDFAKTRDNAPKKNTRDNSLIDSFQLHKGSTQHVSKEVSDELLSFITSITQMPGGTAANSLAGVASLGGKTAYISRIADDSLGNLLVDALSDDGIYFSGKLFQDDLGTGRCISLITPDADRTMVTYLGISHHFSRDDVDWDIIKRAKILLIEAYQFETPDMLSITEEAVIVAKEQGTLIVLSAAHIGCMLTHRLEMLRFIQNYVDIFVGNAEELMALTDQNTKENALKAMDALCERTVMTCGPQGSYIRDHGEAYFIPPPHVASIVDTTGAGDQYLAGFLYGLTQGYTIEECGNIASTLAGQVIQYFGARVPRENCTLRKVSSGIR